MGSAIIEQALVIDITEITGCAHPGIVYMLRTIAGQNDRPIRFVLGGFHLNQTPSEDIRSIIDEFRALGIEYAGATHCTGMRPSGCSVTRMKTDT